MIARKGCPSCGCFISACASQRASRRTETGCLAHAHRKFDKLARAHASPVAMQAIQHIAGLAGDARDSGSRPVGAETTEGSAAVGRIAPVAAPGENARGERRASAAALDYSLRRWDALGRFLQDGGVNIANNHIERLMRPWGMGMKAWLFCGNELADQGTTIVISLAQSAKLHVHDP